MSPTPRPACYAPYTGTQRLPPRPVASARFLEFLPHPGNRAPLAPPRPALKPLPAGWTRSFHAIPAAYPRQAKESHGTFSRDSHPFRKSPPPANETNEQRKERMIGEVDTMIRTRFNATEWELEDAVAAAPQGQFVAVERWRRNVPTGGITIVCTHANGTVKEHWHPVLLSLISRDPATPAYMFGTTRRLGSSRALIDDIWIMDELGHGVSADLNAGRLGNTELWTDCARDIVNFVVHVLPSAKIANTLPWQLEWAPEGAAPPVKVVGFGASFGGAGQVMASHSRPDVFEGIFLVDGMVSPRIQSLALYEATGISIYSRALGALKRRDTWPSRDAARQALGKSPFFAKWDSTIFDFYISHGLVPVDYSNPGGPVTLATPAWYESTIFCEPSDACRTYDTLPTLHVPVGFLCAGDPERTLGEETTHEVVWVAPLARNERASGTDHLIMQQNPAMTAESAWRFLQTLSSKQWGTCAEEIRETYAPEPKARL